MDAFNDAQTAFDFGKFLVQFRLLCVGGDGMQSLKRHGRKAKVANKPCIR